ncbi:hypothetical protein C8R45DRAFT_975067 [Mycena sanguinolenta]|nr:hypothetical protein C8R45DRAFT_975067 [Mycena sanguinolenta]
MTSPLFSMRALVLEQRERTRKSSKADIDRFIEESESKIVSLESQISALVQLRDRERACVAALRHLISPIHTLPVELLAEIFDFAIRDDDYRHVRDVLRISQVCSHWRQIAHSTPRLWSRYIRLDLRKRSVESRTSSRDGSWVPAHCLKAWLLRSSPLAVRVSVALDETFSQRIPDEVLSSAPRWRSLDLDVNDTPVPFISQLAEARLDSLEELDLGLLDFDDDDPPTFTSFATVPRLRQLTMGVCSKAFRFLVPWVQLTYLTFTSYFPNIPLDVLAQCPNLIQAAISTTCWAALPEARQTIPLTQLLRLHLHFFEEEGHFMPFLDCLSAPVLEALRLSFTRMSTHWIQAGFTAFQLRAPNITHLDLQDLCLASDDLQTALRHAPSLTHLGIASSKHCIDDALITALHHSVGVRPLVPHLHVLSLEDIGDNFTEDVLAGMIASRWWAVAESAEVSQWTRVQLCGDFSQHFFDILKDLPPDVLKMY